MLGAGALLLALAVGSLSGSRRAREAAATAARQEMHAATALATRAAPLLQRGDLMRLSVLAAVVGDQTRDRVLLLDPAGEVVIDTALALGGSTLPLLAEERAMQHMLPREGAPPVRETAAPVVASGEQVGEVRLRRERLRPNAVFDWVAFGVAMVAGLALAGLGAQLAAAWSRRVRRGTDALVRLAAGDGGPAPLEDADAELRGFGAALRELNTSMADGLAKVQDGYVQMARDLVAGLEQRQLSPPGHGERTAALLAGLADQLQLTPEDREDLVVAGSLVDLGKASLRPSLLQKQEPLSESEWESLEHHPVHAAERLERVPALSGVAAILRHQLERYDGRGAPEGLRGDRIPLGARALAIASSFDTLTTTGQDRPLGWHEALEKLVRARGEVFDPWLVDLFCEQVRLDPPKWEQDASGVPLQATTWREVDRDVEADEPVGEGAEAELELLPEDAGEGARQP